jgi:nucleoside-diphosphate-sugar epimerase
VATNLAGVVNILESMAKHGVRKFVQASSSSLYAGQPAPFTEEQPVDRPLSPYAASKKASESMAYTYHHLYGIDVTILRYFTVYGPAGRPDMTPLKFVHRIASGKPFPLYGDGEQQRDFTYIDDIARGTVAALKPLGYEIINLGAGREPISINRMIRLFEDFLGRSAIIEKEPVNPADMRDTAADNSKAGRLLGWYPQVKPEEGFRKLVDWYREEEAWLAPLLDLYNG